MGRSNILFGLLALVALLVAATLPAVGRVLGRNAFLPMLAVPMVGWGLAILTVGRRLPFRNHLLGTGIYFAVFFAGAFVAMAVAGELAGR